MIRIFFILEVYLSFKMIWRPVKDFSHDMLWSAVKKLPSQRLKRCCYWLLCSRFLIFHITTGSLTPFQVQNAPWRACRKLHSRIHPVSELRAAIDSMGVNSLLPDQFTEVLKIHLPRSTRFNLLVKHFRAAPVLLRKWYFHTSCADVVLQVRTQADWGGWRRSLLIQSSSL